MQLPPPLRPTSSETVLLPSGRKLEIAKCSPTFFPWTGNPFFTYGKKAIVDVDGTPQYAETAILELLRQSGWEGVWVDTYRNRFWRTIHTQVPRPLQHDDMLQSIQAASGVKGGCWDVFCWTPEFLFCEAKRQKKDKFRPNQLAWLEAALAHSIPAAAFLIVEWNLGTVAV